jgi:hypothetical protein
LQIQSKGVSFHQQTITLKQNAMTNSEIYKLASELTAQEINNVLGAWNVSGETKKTNLFESLVKLGDSRGLAMATVIAETYNKKEESPLYRIAYES